MSSNPDVFAASRRFAKSDDKRAWVELAVTFGLYVAAIIVGLATLGTWWITVPAVVLASTFGLRIYMIQHDCLHRSFFSSRKTNDLIGTLLSAIAMTPYKATRYIHGLHHTYVGDLERRDSFEIFTMTLSEWQAAPRWKRIQYRIYRSPVILVLIGPFILFGVLRRLPLYGLKTGVGDLVFHNASLAAYLGVIWWAAGWPGLAFWVASVYLACVVGGLIPYIVHNFEDVRWGRRPELTFTSAALDGSAVLDWGRLFDLATMNIGYHDLHHLNAKIPGYFLRDAHAALEAEGLIQSEKIGVLEGLRCLRWKLFDEENGRMIPFPSRAMMRQRQSASATFG
ncbi:MAG: fatty acid desaturase [Paracoccaceae bacterium]